MHKILERKLERLKSILSGMQSVVVAFSGGTDSSFLLYAARQVLGKRVLAVIVQSDFLPQAEVDYAVNLAKKWKVKFRVLRCDILSHPKVRQNPRLRCYFCKKEIMKRLVTIAGIEGCDYVVEGSNLDDSKGFRPGRRALKELGIKSPLIEAGFFKQEIRMLAKELKIENADKPSFSCLATRFPYNIKLTKKLLLKAAKAEQQLKQYGIKQVRVRIHHDLARIEVEKKDLTRLEKILSAEKIVRIKKIGFKYITMDLEGYRSGSMD